MAHVQEQVQELLRQLAIRNRLTYAMYASMV